MSAGRRSVAGVQVQVGAGVASGAAGKNTEDGLPERGNDSKSCVLHTRVGRMLPGTGPE